MLRVDKDELRDALDWLKGHATKATLDGMARYKIPSQGAYGTAMRDIQALAKKLGKSHELAAALWETGQYEARMLACYVDEPAKVTPAQMNRWCREFGNWAHCDTACFVLFDRTPHAWSRVEAWVKRRDEIEKRAGFALLWALALHDKDSGRERFERGLELIEQAADDDRHYVKKALAMARGAIARRLGPTRPAPGARPARKPSPRQPPKPRA